MANKKYKGKWISRKTVMAKFGFTPRLMEQYLPKPRLVKNQNAPQAPMIPLWSESEVQHIVDTTPELRAVLSERNSRKKKKKDDREKDIRDFLTGFSPETMIRDGRYMNRRFILHVGPTNSGKTYESLEALKRAESGVYLGPLRLLALEVYENMNRSGVPCSLLTGEECEDMPGANITASTIELCDYNEHYAVAVIDEGQMIADPFRGPNWTKAITSVDADEVHVCLAPEALPLVRGMVERMEAPMEIRTHDRLVPLEYDGFFRDIEDVEPGDALIAFSRRQVLQIAAILEEKNIKASVIYGALPPASRREEVRRFSEHETNIVVATDAIGMGISLPIKRVIFTEAEKFDGYERRPLNRTEVKQIGGRAGRFGKYDVGYVLSMEDPDLVEEGLRVPSDPIEKLTIGFPAEALDYDGPLKDMLEIWDSLPKEETFARADMSDARFLLSKLSFLPKETPKELIYSFITCPVDIKSPKLVEYFLDCCSNIVNGFPVLKPYFGEGTLENCELKYHAYDVYHQLLRRIGEEDECITEKTELSEKINAFLKKTKSGFLRKCRICGKPLDANRFSVCEDCFREMIRGRRKGKPGRKPAPSAGTV